MPSADPSLRLADDEAHVWQVDLNRSSVDDDARVLDWAERERADRYVRMPDRLSFVRTRAALRRIVGRYVQVEPAGISFETDRRGRPRLVPAPGHPVVDFNVSHCDDMALIAVAHASVGVDVEASTAQVDGDAIAAHWFAPEEIACRACTSRSPGVDPFLRHWTAKEAYLKARGCGIGGLRDVAIDCLSASPLRWRGSPDGERQLRWLPMPAGHAAAVVTDTGVHRVVMRTYRHAYV